MQTPTIHLNGTSKEELYQQLEAVSDTLFAAQKALQGAAPNARDYYPQGGKAFAFAVGEHLARVTALESIQQEIETLLEHVANAGSR